MPPPPPVENEPEEDGIVPDVEKRSRSSKLAKLESAVGGLYIMLGGAMSTVPEQVGGERLKFIGLSVAKSADEIAEAWIDLAEDDRRVLKALESLTSFSGWGKVIGVHLMVVGTAVPGIAAMPSFGGGMMGAPVGPQGAPPQQPNGGASDAQAAMIVAEIFRQAQSQQRAQAAQAPPPGYGQAPPPPPMPEQQQQAGVRVAPTGPARVRAGRGAGIPSASDLFGGGTPIPDVPLDFPSASDPQDAGM